MKVNLLGKFKWYIVGFILVAIMLSVSLSFCTWDTLSLKASMNAKGGSYEIWSNHIKDSDGNKLTKAPSVGQVVQYGRFYQEADAITTGKTAPQRWIVVDYDTTSKVATLLAEKVVVFGNFWGGDVEYYYQNYYQSTVRSWLNSGKGSLKGNGSAWKDSERYDDNTRTDGIGSAFSVGAKKQVNRGFLDVAFTVDEKSILVPKNITGIHGFEKNGNIIEEYKTTDDRAYINDLVWLPSYPEIYGTSETRWGEIHEGGLDRKILYFDDLIVHEGTVSPFRGWVSAKAISGATAYALNANASSYYNDGLGLPGGSALTTTWSLRSTSPRINSILVVYWTGSSSAVPSSSSNQGVRPAVCVQL